MNFRPVFNFMVMFISVLALKLFTDTVVNYAMTFKEITTPLRFTAIGMIVTAVILVPAFSYLNNILHKATERLFKRGSKVFGKALGAVLIFAVLLFILFCIYAWRWFGVDVPQQILKSIFK